jgi:hypothetical protein
MVAKLVLRFAYSNQKLSKSSSFQETQLLTILEQEKSGKFVQQ